MAVCKVCGSQVGLLKKRLTTHAADLLIGVRFLNDNAEAIGQALSTDSRVVERHAEDGEYMARDMHRYAHGARPDGTVLGSVMLPTQQELFSWQNQTNGLAAALFQANQRTFEAYVSGLRGHAVRLVRSMPFGPGQLAPGTIVQLQQRPAAPDRPPRSTSPMPTCRECGHPNPPGANYCSDCGARFQSGPPSSSSSPVHQEPPQSRVRAPASQQAPPASIRADDDWTHAKVRGTCARCGLQVIEGWRRCPDCGNELTSAGTVVPPPDAWEASEPIGECPGCGLQLIETWSQCPDCGLHLTRSRAIHGDDTHPGPGRLESPDEPQYMIPRPIGPVANQLSALLKLYVEARSTAEPKVALSNALRRLLSVDEQRELRRFMAGKIDYLYGAGKGKEFARELLQKLEEAHSDIKERIAGAQARYRMTDIDDERREINAWREEIRRRHEPQNTRRSPSRQRAYEEQRRREKDRFREEWNEWQYRKRSEQR